MNKYIDVENPNSHNKDSNMERERGNKDSYRIAVEVSV